MKWIKWFNPVLSYLIFLGLWFFWAELIQPDFPKENPGPSLPGGVMVVLALPLIPSGYFALFVALLIRSKSVIAYRIFALLSVIVPVTFGICSYCIKFGRIDDWSHTLLFYSRPVLFYAIPFWGILHYVCRKKEWFLI